NPIGAILSVGMMLDFLGEKRAADQIESAIAQLLTSRRIPSVDAKSGLTTVEIGDLITREIQS
ncbi:MAG TPA: isocitrate/isopropylmalate family dehydrogenase, partial [Anaerolineae bacterium]|nr:isocitrate/isopropylmalate family dehydrogenase [Anaerolineae bacterium]